METTDPQPGEPRDSAGTHRGHGHTLAKGAEVRRMMAELFGKAGGFNGGKGGSMHIADFSVGMLGANGVVVAGLAIAVGAAQGLQLQVGGGLSARVVCCFFDDGATNRGPSLESLNWAAVFGCPVLFVFWESWTPADREIVRQAAIDAGKQNIDIARKGMVGADQPLLKDIAAMGVTITKLTPAEREAFVAMTRPVYDKWKAQIGAPLVTKAEQSIAARKK